MKFREDIKFSSNKICWSTWASFVKACKTTNLAQVLQQILLPENFTFLNIQNAKSLADIEDNEIQLCSKFPNGKTHF